MPSMRKVGTKNVRPMLGNHGMKFVKALLSINQGIKKLEMSSFLVKLLVVFLALTQDVSRAQLDSSPLLSVKGLGLVRGASGRSFFTNRTIYQFFGINYAKPPSGHRRFKPPVEFGPWKGVYDARKMRQRCPQVDSDYYPSPAPELLDIKEDIEDCLVLNVFTPSIRGDKGKMPVLFYIHGGSFYMGSAYDFLPGFLLEEDIVLVVIQYRLGPLGFLCLHTDQIPGNMAMLDVILALRWVKKHIGSFGGDPSQITVYGQSAGSAITSSLLLSPLVEKGLFDKMILSSSSALVPRNIDEDPIGTAKGISLSLGCNTKNIGGMTRCLKSVPPLELMQAHSRYLNKNPTVRGRLNSGGRGFVIQKAGTQKFLVQHPPSTFPECLKFSVPLLGGTTRDDGSFLLAILMDSLRLIDENGITPDQQRTLIKTLVSLNEYEDFTGLLTDLLMETYFPGPKNRTYEEILPPLQDIAGMFLIKYPTYNFMRGVSHNRNVYAYSFNFLGNISKLRDSDPDWNKKYPFPIGVAHSDELGYIFPSRSRYTDRELRMVRTMTRYWTHFIKTGAPIVTRDPTMWPKMSTPFGPYLEISDTSKVKHNILHEYEVATKEGFLH